MKTLWLVRHARAESLSPKGLDKDRRLTTEGLGQATRLAHLLSTENVKVDRMLISAATRTQETADILLHVLKEGVKSYQVLEDLYLAPADSIWQLIKSSEPQTDSIMVVGHNPGLEVLARAFVPALDGLPTSGLVEIKFDVQNWSDASAASVASTRCV